MQIKLVGSLFSYFGPLSAASLIDKREDRRPDHYEGFYLVDVHML
jgi:hypothetical protein